MNSGRQTSKCLGWQADHCIMYRQERKPLEILSVDSYRLNRKGLGSNAVQCLGEHEGVCARKFMIGKRIVRNKFIDK